MPYQEREYIVHKVPQEALSEVMKRKVMQRVRIEPAATLPWGACQPVLHDMVQQTLPLWHVRPDLKGSYAQNVAHVFD